MKYEKETAEAREHSPAFLRKAARKATKRHRRKAKRGSRRK